MPSRHSSSSHSSSSHSSFGGGGFHHSSSSHSSFTRFNSDSSSDSSFSRRTRTVTTYVMPAEKPRRNQPTRSGSAISSYSLIRSVKHDYFFYPEDWTDDTTGKQYKRGYYDEDGLYSKQVIIRRQSQYETRAICNYCGTQIKLKWSQGALPSCPSCGASLSEIMDGAVIEEAIKAVPQTSVVTDDSNPDDAYFQNGQHIGMLDKVDTRTLSSSEKEESIKSNRIAGVVIMSIVFIIMLFVITGAIEDDNSSKYRGQIVTLSAEEIEAQEQEESRRLQTATPTPTPIPEYYFKFVADADFSQTIYVDALGRECSWHSSGNYYDPQTDCYFWLNTTVEPPIWQYWYEGISSAYGDYGWMEYDFSEDTWYIEESEGNWIVLPQNKYDKDRLWHMSSPDDGRFMCADMIYVYEIDRSCEYIKEERNYYDPVTKCHFYYDTYTGKGVWCYWFEEFIEKNPGHGWMKYSNEEKCWCFAEISTWHPIPDNIYDFSECWHIETPPTPIEPPYSEPATSEETSSEMTTASETSPETT